MFTFSGPWQIRRTWDKIDTTFIDKDTFLLAVHISIVCWKAFSLKSSSGVTWVFVILKIPPWFLQVCLKRLSFFIYPIVSKCEALGLGVHLILLYFIRILVVGTEIIFLFCGCGCGCGCGC